MTPAVSGCSGDQRSGFGSTSPPALRMIISERWRNKSGGEDQDLRHRELVGVRDGQQR
jgi:hypothetical protein